MDGYGRGRLLIGDGQRTRRTEENKKTTTTTGGGSFREFLTFWAGVSLSRSLLHPTPPSHSLNWSTHAWVMDSRLRAYPIHGLVGWLDKRARREMMMMGGFSQVHSGFLLVFGSSLTLSLSRLIGRHTRHARTLGSWVSQRGSWLGLVWLDKRRRGARLEGGMMMNGAVSFSLGSFGFSLCSTLSPNRSTRHARLGHGFPLQGSRLWLVWLDKWRRFSARRDDGWEWMDGRMVHSARGREGTFVSLCDTFWPVFSKPGSGPFLFSHSHFFHPRSFLSEPWTGWVGRLRRTTGVDCDGMGGLR